MSTSGNTNKEWNRPLFKEFFWRIEYRQLVDANKFLTSNSFNFCGQRWVLTLQPVKISTTEETLFILCRLQPHVKVVPLILYWSLGIVRANEGRCLFGKGRVENLKNPWSSCYVAAEGFGPRFSDLVDEEKGFFIPGVGVTISIRLSCDPAETESPATVDVSVQTEDEDRRDIGWKLTKEDERMVQQFRQMLRSEEDKEYILRVRREESKANCTKFLEQLPKDNDQYDFFAA